MKTAYEKIKGAIAQKDLIPWLNHIHIYDGRMQATNGVITIDAPCPKLKDYSLTVPADSFSKSLVSFNNDPTLSIAEPHLILKQGSCKAKVILGKHEEYPRRYKIEPEHKCNNIAETLRLLVPFMGKDASRPWSNGICFKNGYAYATNNVCLIRATAQDFGLPINIPEYIVTEIIRIGEEPQFIAVTENIITLFYADSTWISGSLLSANWPEMDKFFENDATEEIPVGLYSAVTNVAQFIPDSSIPVINLGENGISTNDGLHSAENKDFSLPTSRFNAIHLMSILNIATHLQLSAYPLPCTFKSNRVEGVIIGIRA